MNTKPSRNVYSGKPEIRHRQQSFLPHTFVLYATGSLELRVVSSAISEHTNNNTSRSGLAIVSNNRRTMMNYIFRTHYLKLLQMCNNLRRRQRMFIQRCINVDVSKLIWRCINVITSMGHMTAKSNKYHWDHFIKRNIPPQPSLHIRRIRSVHAVSEYSSYGILCM